MKEKHSAVSLPTVMEDALAPGTPLKAPEQMHLGLHRLHLCVRIRCPIAIWHLMVHCIERHMLGDTACQGLLCCVKGLPAATGSGYDTIRRAADAGRFDMNGSAVRRLG